MFLVLVVQGVEGRDRDFRFAQIAGRCFLLPEFVAAAEVQKVVAADARFGGITPNGGEGEKRLIDMGKWRHRRNGKRPLR